MLVLIKFVQFQVFSLVRSFLPSFVSKLVRCRVPKFRPRSLGTSGTAETIFKSWSLNLWPLQTRIRNHCSSVLALSSSTSLALPMSFGALRIQPRGTPRGNSDRAAPPPQRSLFHSILSFVPKPPSILRFFSAYL